MPAFLLAAPPDAVLLFSTEWWSQFLMSSGFSGALALAAAIIALFVAGRRITVDRDHATEARRGTAWMQVFLWTLAAASEGKITPSQEREFYATLGDSAGTPQELQMVGVAARAAAETDAQSIAEAEQESAEEEHHGVGRS